MSCWIKNFLVAGVVASLLLAITACNRKSEESASEGEAINSVPHGGEVLARVNGEDITEADVAGMIDRTFSVAEQLSINADVERKVLESLVAARAMRQSVERDMTAREKFELEQKVKAYKEELYIKEYMNRHVSPEPVTTAMVKEYYESHPERFGGGVLKTFEMLKPKSALNEEQRDRLLASAAKINASEDWASLAMTLNNEIELAYLSTRATPEILTDELARVLSSLKAGETSGFVLENQAPVIYRVTKEETIPPKPLAEVSGEIRKMLAPLNLKKAVKRVTDEVVKQSNVEYINKEN